MSATLGARRIAMDQLAPRPFAEMLRLEKAIELDERVAPPGQAARLADQRLRLLHRHALEGRARRGRDRAAALLARRLARERRSTATASGPRSGWTEAITLVATPTCPTRPGTRRRPSSSRPSCPISSSPSPPSTGGTGSSSAPASSRGATGDEARHGLDHGAERARGGLRLPRRAGQPRALHRPHAGRLALLRAGPRARRARPHAPRETRPPGLDGPRGRRGPPARDQRRGDRRRGRAPAHARDLRPRGGTGGRNADLLPLRVAPGTAHRALGRRVLPARCSGTGTSGRWSAWRSG